MRMRLKKTCSGGGFTLIESVVGIGVVGVMVVSLYAALTSGVRTVQLGREDQRATQILVQSLDQVRLFSWDQITNSAAVPATFTTYFDPEDDHVHSKANAHANYHANSHKSLIFKGTVTIADAPNDTTYSGDMKQV